MDFIVHGVTKNQTRLKFWHSSLTREKIISYENNWIREAWEEHGEIQGKDWNQRSGKDGHVLCKLSLNFILEAMNKYHKGS